MNKYQKMMESVEMTEEMKASILNGLPQQKKKRHWKRPVQVLCAAAAMLMVIVCIGALPKLTARYSTDGFYSSGAAVPSDTIEAAGEESGMVMDDSMDSGWNGTAENSKNSGLSDTQADGALIIYHGNLTIQTKDYDQTVSDIQALCEQYKGYISDESASTGYDDLRICSLGLRIPSEDYQAFVSKIRSTQNVTDSWSSSENITRQYYDAKTRLDTLKAEQERLQQLMDKAESVSDLIDIESRMQEVEQQLQWASQDLSSMDLDLEYSTLNVDIIEVQVLAPSSSSWSGLPQAFADAWFYFYNGLGTLILLLVYALPWVLLIAAAAAALVWLIRKRKKHQLEVIEKKSAKAKECSNEKIQTNNGE